MSVPKELDMENPTEAIELKLEKSKKLKILMVTIAEMGNFMPILNIANELRSRGHSVTILTNHYHLEKMRKIAGDLADDIVSPSKDKLERETFLG